MTTTEARIHAVRKHLAEYEREGHNLRAEAAQITEARKLIETSPLVHLTFGRVARDTMSGPDHVRAMGRAIVLGEPAGIATVKASQDTRMHDRCERASEIAYPGLKACLLMWLNEWEARVRRDLAAWEARDPIAEAAALPVPDAATVPAPPIA